MNTGNSLDGFSVDPQWRERFNTTPFGPTVKLREVEIQCQIVFSLIIYFNLSLRDFLFFIFESNIHAVKLRAGVFLSHNPNNKDRFLPSTLYHLWHNRFPKCRPHLDRFLIEPWAQKLVLNESNAIINDDAYRIHPRLCTVDTVRDILHPGKIAAMYKTSAPFTWSLLETFTTSENSYRRKMAKQPDGVDLNDTDDVNHDAGDDHEEIDDRFQGELPSNAYGKGFARNPEI